MKRPAAAKAKPQSSAKAETKDVAADDQLDQPVQPEEPSPKKIELQPTTLGATSDPAVDIARKVARKALQVFGQQLLENLKVVQEIYLTSGCSGGNVLLVSVHMMLELLGSGAAKEMFQCEKEKDRRKFLSLNEFSQALICRQSFGYC